ncbi:MAG: response regulator transcription factor [Halanaerobiales bacterium]
MIINSDIKFSESLKELFAGENYIVEIVHEGVSGLYSIMNNNYDTIILDIDLPDMEGIDVVTYVREKGRNTPIIIVTAKSNPTDIINSLDRGADDYITRPFHSGELLARLRALYRRSSYLLQEDTISFSNITLNLSTIELCSQNKKASLTQKEFEIFKLFINNPHHVLSKDMIISKIWSFDDDVSYNTLEAHISSLRNKLKRISSTAEIVTVRGIGYKLDED